MLRFSHPAMMNAAMRRCAFAPSRLSCTATLQRSQSAAFSTRNFFGASSSIVAPSMASSPSPSLSSSSALKEQKMTFIAGPSRAWLARMRGGSGSGSSGSSDWSGQVVQNNAPEQYTNPNDSQGGEVLSPAVREHLMKVYNLLAVSVGFAAAGSAAMIMTPLGKMIPWFIPCFGGLVPLLWLWFKPPANPVARQGLVLAFATLQGMGIAPIVKATASAGVLGSALVMTGAVFAGFSAAAFLAPRASLVAFQGPLMGMFFGMFAISILNMFYPMAFAHSLILYGGLAIFSAFVAVDTQVMIERARCGQGDVAHDALNMFVNVLQIFIRIAEILRGMSQ